MIKATDADSGLNALLLYEILEEHAKKYFSIDSSTGALRTISGLDYESQTMFEFRVRVSDMGRPRLSAETTASVRIFVQDENDSAPKFAEEEYFSLLLLPTFDNVTITRLSATDADTRQQLGFSITAGNQLGLFTIQRASGRVLVKHARGLEPGSKHSLTVTVSDGKWSEDANNYPPMGRSGCTVAWQMSGYGSGKGHGVHQRHAVGTMYPDNGHPTTPLHT